MSKKQYDTSNGLCGTLWEPKATWAPPTNFPNLSGVKRLALDIESRDPNLTDKGPGFIRGDASVVGISIATVDRGWYFPIGHLGGGNMDRDAVTNYIRDALAVNDREIIGANLSYELEGLSSMGISIAGRLTDIQLCEALIDEERDLNYTLETLCSTYLGIGKSEELLKEAADAYGVHPKNGLWKLPAKYVGAYAEFDAFSCIGIADRQSEVIRAQNLGQIVALEMSLIPVLHAMRMQGIPVDLEKAQTLTNTLQKEEDTLALKIKRDFGSDINVWSGQHLARVCDRLSIDYPRTAKGLPSFVGDWLDGQTHPFLELVTELRTINKLRKDYVDGWIFKNNIKGRIHPQWKQLMSDEGGTRTGRMAASNPNPQQIPSSKKKDGSPNPVGAAIRALFIPPKDKKWCKLDYSQQEPRILAHFAALCNLSGAEAAAFAYRSNPKMDFYKFMEDIAGIARREAKTMYLGLCYGMGKDKLASKLGKTKADCERLMAQFNEHVPFVKELADKCSNLAQTRGYIRTLCGRRRHFNYWEPANAYKLREAAKREKRYIDLRPRLRKEAELEWPKEWLIRAGTHKALNALNQGSAADMMKAGLVKGFVEDGRIPFITVHDEIGGAVDDQEDADKWKKTMETCVKMTVPIYADLYMGNSWK